MTDAMRALLAPLKGGLIVSCQAAPNEPLFGPSHIRALALSVLTPGVVGLRIEGPEDVAAVVEAVAGQVPVVGLWKIGRSGVYITPTLDSAREIARAGAAIVAIDGTARPRQDSLSLRETISALHKDGIVVMADVSTLREGIEARDAGADIVSTTLSGYTEMSPSSAEPDLDLVRELVASIDVPVVAEGRYVEPHQAREALDAGAHAVVVGGAITRPGLIARRFVEGMRNDNDGVSS